MCDDNSVNGGSAAAKTAAVLSMAAAAGANPLNIKDSRWLQLEVCREFQRGQCSRSENECKFAHPPPHVEVQNGLVTACFDSIKSRCNRENPKCKYLHPPQHLKEQLQQNGKNALALKNLIQLQYANAATAPATVVAPSATATLMGPLMESTGWFQGQTGYSLPGVATATYPQYYTLNPQLLPGLLAANPGVAAALQASAILPSMSVASSPNVSVANGINTSQMSKLSRNDRIEPLQPALKRMAGEKSGVPMYQPVTALNAATALQYHPQFATYPIPLTTGAATFQPIIGQPACLQRF
jgi:hypothetical protein